MSTSNQRSFKKAIEHLQETLGDQYSMNATKFAWNKFQDYVEQDIEYKMACDSCDKVDSECDFQEHQNYGNLCYDCYEEKGGDV